MKKNTLPDVALVKNENKHRMKILGVVAAALLGAALWFVLMPQGKAPVPVEVDSATVTEADTANEAGAGADGSRRDEIDK
ncbi:MAG: hypothetical protein R3C68_14745 [Myxococcota bacterium]